MKANNQSLTSVALTLEFLFEDYGVRLGWGAGCHLGNSAAPRIPAFSCSSAERSDWRIRRSKGRELT